MNGPRFIWPNEMPLSRDLEANADIPEELRQQIIATTQDALAHQGLPSNVAEHFAEVLRDFEAMRSSP